MPEQTTVVIVAAVGVAILVMVIFAGLHEKHYRDRRGEILRAKLGGMEERLSTVESILAEDRLT